MTETIKMLFLIDADGNYYEAEHNITGATEVPRRPSYYHDWVDGAWIERKLEAAKATYDATISALTKSVRQMLDDEAMSRGYDSILTACSYASTQNEFMQEGIAFVEWRSKVWTAFYAILEAVKSGSRTTPTTDELLTELPVIPFA